MKKILSLLFLAAVSLGTVLVSGIGGRACGDDCMDGGVTRRTCDAPRSIRSTEIAALDADFFLYDGDGGGTGWSFTIRRKGEAFLLSMKRRGKEPAEKAVGRGLLDKVHAAILKHGLPRLNGFDEVTSGLPYDYAPCCLSVDYASGERLYFCMDGDPEAVWARDLRDLFLSAFGEH